MKPANPRVPVARLQRARALIATPSRWTVRTSARDVNDHAVGEGSSKAVKWCLIGALWRVHCTYFEVRLVELCLPKRRNAAWSIAEFNDASRRTHAQILKVLDCAIAKAKAATA